MHVYNFQQICRCGGLMHFNNNNNNIYIYIYIYIYDLFQGILKNCHCANATYLFQQDKCYDVSYDTGDKVIIINRLYILHGSRKKITRKTDKTKAKLDKPFSLVIPEKSPLRNCVLDHTSLPPEFESRRGHIFEGRFIFDFASLPLEVAWPIQPTMCTKAAVKHKSS